MKTHRKNPRIGKSSSPLFRKQPELETGLSRMAAQNSSEKNTKKIMQQVDAIRIADMIIGHDKK